MRVLQCVLSLSPTPCSSRVGGVPRSDLLLGGRLFGTARRRDFARLAVDDSLVVSHRLPASRVRAAADPESRRAHRARVVRDHRRLDSGAAQAEGESKTVVAHEDSDGHSDRSAEARDSGMRLGLLLVALGAGYNQTFFSAKHEILKQKKLFVNCLRHLLWIKHMPFFTNSVFLLYLSQKWSFS